MGRSERGMIGTYAVRKTISRGALMRERWWEIRRGGRSCRFLLLLLPL
jgi:hypothetical protein